MRGVYGKKTGFTIVELLIVIVVIGILAAITIVAFRGVNKRATESVVKSDLKSATTQLGIESTATGSYPANAEQVNDGKGLVKSDDTAFQYTYTESTNSYCLSATSSKQNIAYHVQSSSGSIADGLCDGHHMIGGPAGEGKSYALGDKGPAGGIVFYDKGSVSDGWRYLEAAPTDLPGSYEWGCYNILVTGASATTIGSGRQNTSSIISKNCAPVSPGNSVAVTAVAAYSLAGFEDWFLPSIDELDKLYRFNPTVTGIQLGSQAYYWSSSTIDGNNRVSITKKTGSPAGGSVFTLNRNTLQIVRPVRAF